MRGGLLHGLIIGINHHLKNQEKQDDVRNNLE